MSNPVNQYLAVCVSPKPDSGDKQTQERFALFTEQPKVPGIMPDGVVNPRSTHRFRAPEWWDDTILASWTQLLGSQLPTGSAHFADSYLYKNQMNSTKDIKKIVCQFGNLVCLCRSQPEEAIRT